MGKCQMCGQELIAGGVKDYLRCVSCGHEIRNENFKEEAMIVNDQLSKEAVLKTDRLEKFKRKVVEEVSSDKNFLLDIGSSSGKFLYHNRDLFRDYLGIEVTPSCVAFSRDVLGLNIKTKLDDADLKTISVISFWHSLEHLKISNFEQMMAVIMRHTNQDTKLVISVPNSESMLYRIAGQNYAYYDPESHIHQFSKESLGKLLERFGFAEEKVFFSLSYSFFGYLQSFINYGNLRHNFLYYHLKRGTEFGLNKWRIRALFFYNVFLSAVFFIPALLGVIYDSFVKERGAILTICYQIKKP